MDRKNFAATLAALIWIAGAADAARADVLTATVTGVFGNATDLYLFFPNSASPVSLQGDPFSATFVYDTSLGGVHMMTANSDTVAGGSTFGTTSPVLSATLTAEGKTFAVPGLDDTSVSVGGVSGVYGISASDVSLDRYIQITLYPAGGVPDLLTTPFSGTDPSHGTGQFDVTAGGAAVAYGNLIPETVTVTDAIPEISTWAMTILGFAGVGFMAYRRNRNAELARSTFRV